MKKGFKCSKCGRCCQIVGQMVENSKNFNVTTATSVFEVALNNLLHGFSPKYDEKGRCEHLGADNLCKIYDHRPLMCNVDRTYKKIFKMIMSKKDFYKNNHKNCEIIRGLFEKENA